MIRFRSSSPQFRAALVGSLLFCCLTPLVHAQRPSGTDAVEAGRARYNLDSDDNAGATDNNNTTTTTTTRTTRVRRRPATTTVRSYDSSTESTVERARSRYAADAAGAEEHISVGDSAVIRKDYDLASREYRAAVDALPPAPATADRRAVAVKKFFDATMMLANQRITEGRYVDAETTVKVILRPEYDPGYKPAVTMLKHLEDPEYYNQTVTPAFVDRVQKVKQLFIDAQGYYDTARYDLAYKRYEQILALDPYNDAARRGQERVDLARAKHFDPVSYDHTRGRLLTEVDRGWDLPVRRQGPDAESRRNLGKVRDDQGNAALMRKLQSILIPNIEFRSTTVADAIEFLRQESRRLDLDPDPEARGVNIFLKLTSSGAPAVRAVAPVDPVIPGLPTEAVSAAGGGVAAVAGPSASTRITLTMSRLPLLEALRYVAQQAGLKVKVEQYAVSIVPLTEVTDTLVTQEFRVSPTFISSATTGGLGGGALGQGAVSATATGATGSTDVAGVGSVNIQRQDAKTFLEASGVTFPPGASATYLASTSKLVVRNTQENIDLIESLVQENSPVIKQVEIESKFIEITQQNLKELSFDWTLGQANVPGSSKVFFGGGTSGDGRSVSGTDFPFVNSVTNAVVGGTAVTAGNRSGTYGISANAIDALLFGSGAAAAAPGIFSLAGVFTDPQFQLVVRALNQQKGVDLLSAPRVTTKSGQKATIEIIREFIYPTQFQPPQIPQNFGNSNNNGGTTILNPLTGILSSGGSGGGTFPVTPTTPTNFEKRNTGVTLEVEPVIGPDNYTIDLNLQPQVVDFDGFVNYGSPIQTTSTNALGMTQVNVITPNVINQPIFDTRKVSTSVSVFDGSTVVLGGLVREDVQKVNDKVPILGDVPLVGRLFRSKIDQNIKRNLIIFVTAHLITPDGQLVLSSEEEEESVQPLNGPDYVPATRMQMIPSKK